MKRDLKDRSENKKIFDPHDLLEDKVDVKRYKIEEVVAEENEECMGNTNVYLKTEVELEQLSLEDGSLVFKSVKRLVLSLSKVESSQAVQILACLRSKYGLVSLQERGFDWVVSLLFKHLELAESDTLKTNYIRTIAYLGHFPEANPSHIVALYHQRMQNESSVSCKKAIYSAIHDLVSTKLLSEGNEGFLGKALEMCWEDLKNPSHIMRCSSINLLGLLASKLAPISLPLSADDIQVLLVNFGADPDPRVRKEAIKAITNLHLRGSLCKPSHYKLCVTRLMDEYEDVRLQSLDLLGLVCGTYPDEMVEVATDKARLIDDAFMNVCNIVHDSSPRVRSKGFQLLGSFHKTDSKLLLQTFSKKMIARSRNDPEPSQAPNQNRTTQITADGEYEMAPDELRILKSGECGAFIHGLEDEFQEVRAASVDSICELCMNSQDFATKAVDFLVDAFNDEIDTVRMNSIASLAKIRSAFPLTIDEEQLQIVLSVLEDKKPSIRSAVHEILGLLLLDRATILPTLVNGLMVNLDKHPGDLPTIYKCLKLTGLRHCRFIDEGFIHTLFQVDKKFLTVEGSPEDPIYVAKAILVFNASFANPRLVKHFPAYLIKHFPYLKHKFPSHLIETNSEAQDFGVSPTSILAPLVKSDPEKLLKLLDSTAQAIPELTFNEENLAKIKEYQKTFVYLTSNLTSKAGKARFLAGLLDSSIIVIESQKKASHSFDGLFLEGTRLLELSYRLEHQFLGANRDFQVFFAELRVLASLYCYIGKVVSEPTHWIASARALSLIVKRVQANLAIQPPNSTHPYLNGLTAALSKTDDLHLDDLVKFSMNYPLQIPTLPNVVKNSKAVILTPESNPHKPIEIVAGLPLRLQIKGELLFVDDVSSICIQICFPDQSTHKIWPPGSSFVPQSPFHYNFQTDISLLLPAWKDPCSFQIRLVKSFTPDTIFDPALLNVSHGLVNAPPNQSNRSSVHLSAPLNIFVQCRKST